MQGRPQSLPHVPAKLDGCGVIAAARVIGARGHQLGRAAAVHCVRVSHKPAKATTASLLEPSFTAPRANAQLAYVILSDLSDTPCNEKATSLAESIQATADAWRCIGNSRRARFIRSWGTPHRFSLWQLHESAVRINCNAAGGASPLPLSDGPLPHIMRQPVIMQGTRR